MPWAEGLPEPSSAQQQGRAALGDRAHGVERVGLSSGRSEATGAVLFQCLISALLVLTGQDVLKHHAALFRIARGLLAGC